ncbi:hypothetical protein L873DRAFT_1805493 [Choiromyces venosus 120613-1]|uniref:Uncharacterized protein n=1 Tax=Choiromyces venosus 120613-1 TaxID=1336337 RepID=A0A3N4JPU0_9PEZI|nr:hypothetical protein L873DRAFT_1805493 [Choiromyces venosus 120613-1]
MQQYLPLIKSSLSDYERYSPVQNMAARRMVDIVGTLQREGEHNLKQKNEAK